MQVLFPMSVEFLKLQRGEEMRKRENIAEEEEDHYSSACALTPTMPRQRRRMPADGCRDLISLLPDECIQVVFSFLRSPRERCACAAVCKKWLLLLAHMRGSHFKSLNSPRKPGGAAEGYCCPAAAGEAGSSRCLEASEANDARVAAMAVGTYAEKLLGVLSLRGGSPSSITDFGLHIISHSFPNLRSLSLWDCFMVSSSGLACIAQCCPGLEKLDIMNSPRISDDGLLPVGENCRKLATLIIESCPLVGNRALESFAKSSSNLESISITKCPLVGDAGVISVVSRLPKLTKVRLSQLKVGDAVLEAIGKHRGSSIKVLSLENLAGVTMAGFRWMESAGNLEFLSLRSCVGFTDVDAGFGVLGRAMASQTITFGCHLKHVEVKGCRHLTDEALISLTKSTTQSLESLELHRCPSITVSGLLGALKNCCSTLKSLSLSECDSIGVGIAGTVVVLEEEESPAPEKGIERNGGFRPLLESLTLKKCIGIEDGFLWKIGSLCSNISHIGLVGLPSVTDKGVASLLRCVSRSCAKRTPARVVLRDCAGVTDSSTETVARAFGGRLSSLSLDGCRGVGDRSLDAVAELCTGLTELDVSRCGGVSDGGVGRLARAEQQKLKVLSLAGCEGVTDLSLSWLEVMCAGLVGLNVRRCGGVTAGGVDSVRETLWWCDLLADY